MACIIAPVGCGVFGIIIINSGLVYIRLAYRTAKNNPVSVEIAGEQQVLGKIDKRLAVRVKDGGCGVWWLGLIVGSCVCACVHAMSESVYVSVYVFVSVYVYVSVFVSV